MVLLKYFFLFTNKNVQQLTFIIFFIFLKIVIFEEVIKKLRGTIDLNYRVTSIRGILPEIDQAWNLHVFKLAQKNYIGPSYLGELGPSPICR